MMMFCLYTDLPAVVIPAFVVDKLGRKLTMEITCILSFSLLLPLIMHQNETVSTPLLFGARMFISATFSVTTVYASEVDLGIFFSVDI